jgi:hypothetical protein
MECRRCKLDSAFHNFEFLARTSTGESVYYTCPAKGKERDMKKDSIQDYVAHMDEASIGAWYWIIDCSGLESFHMPNISTLQMFLGVIQDRYKYVLKKVFIINCNWKMNVILSMIKPFMKDQAKERLTVVSSKLQFFENGFDTATLLKLNI